MLGNTMNSGSYVLLQLADTMIISDNWLQEHNPQVDWIHGSLTLIPQTVLRKDASLGEGEPTLNIPASINWQQRMRKTR